MTESKCDMTAIPAPIEVSFPYALGMTMVFNPKGIAREQSAQMKISRGIFIKKDMAIKINGIIRSLTAEMI